MARYRIWSANRSRTTWSLAVPIQLHQMNEHDYSTHEMMPVAGFGLGQAAITNICSNQRPRDGLGRIGFAETPSSALSHGQDLTYRFVERRAFSERPLSATFDLSMTIHITQMDRSKGFDPMLRASRHTDLPHRNERIARARASRA